MIINHASNAIDQTMVDLVFDGSAFAPLRLRGAVSAEQLRTAVDRACSRVRLQDPGARRGPRHDQPPPKLEGGSRL